MPTRGVVLHDLVNIVDARDSVAARFLAASDGQIVPEQGEVRTGSSSKARLEISAGGSVRLAQHTSVGINLLGGTDSDPLTQLTFGVGQLWVSLTGGRFEAQTPMGVATVRGSYAEFQYDPGADPNSTLDDALTIQCIDGYCTFNNGSGPINIANLQQLVITQGGQTITGPTNLSAAAVIDFLANSPESADVVLTLTAAVPSATTAPTTTTAPTATDTDTPTPTTTDTPSATPTRTRRPTAVPPSDTPAPSDTPLPSDTPPLTGTDTPQPAPAGVLHRPYTRAEFHNCTFGIEMCLHIRKWAFFQSG